jgi:hypothetical protein
MLEAFEGSTTDARMQFNLWYDGALIQQDVKVGAWKMGWDASRQVRCQTDATILDDDGSLTPWDLDDALGTGGGILQSKLLIGNMSLAVGWQPVTEANPEETWRILDGTTQWIPGGASIPVSAEDVTEDILAYRFLSPEAPKAGNGSIAEIQRLLTGLCDVRVDDAVVDKAVPAGLIYKEDRMDAVEDLVGNLGALWKITGDGQFHVYMESTEPVWETTGGSEGNIIRVQRQLSRAKAYNAFVSRNTAADGTELQGIALEDKGAARFGGPLKVRTLYHAASLATTQAAVLKDAQTVRDNRRLKSTAVLPLRVVLHPGLEVNDWITVNMPLPDGSEAPITGKVLTIDWSGSGSVPVGMDLKLECNALQLQAASARVKASRWLAQ